jgi:NlpC/P60 family putative phage cell wall peptidase
MSHGNLIVNEARSWIGTRFVHQGRVKKNASNRGGCDCIGLVVGVADNVGIMYHGSKLSQYDRLDYAKMPDGTQLEEAFCIYLDRIKIDEIRPADILMFRFNKDPQHVGIIGDCGDDFSLIHCYLQARKVVEHRLDEHWYNRIVAAFRFKTP